MKCDHKLVPTDFSPGSEHAVTAAMGLARRLGARLTLMHAARVPEAFSVVNSDAYLRVIESTVQREMETGRKRVEEAAVPVDTLVTRGAAAEKIVETALGNDVDLIVMGTHGRTGLRHLLIGSVAEHVVRRAPCPVLVVPGKSDKR